MWLKFKYLGYSISRVLKGVQMVSEVFTKVVIRPARLCYVSVCVGVPQPVIIITCSKGVVSGCI